MLRYCFISIISALLLLAGISSGCSKAGSDGISVDINPDIQPQASAFPSAHNESTYDETLRATATFDINVSDADSLAESTSKKIAIKRFRITASNGFVQLRNNGNTAYDTRIILDSMEPSGLRIENLDSFDNNRTGLDFGIIPKGMISTARIVSIPNGIISLKAHIEYREKAYYENGDTRLHSSQYTDYVIPGTATKAIIGDRVILGCDHNLDKLYPVLSENNLLLSGLIEPLDIYEAKITDKRNPYDIVDLLNRNPIIHHAEVESVLSPSYFPNDPIYDPAQPTEYRWAYERISAVKTWDYYSDRRIDESGNALVNGIVFAILDTGITNHTDLALDSTDLALIAQYGKNFASPGQPVTDTDGHGTSVAGIMGAMGNNSIGMAGMAWNPLFLPVKVFNTSKEYGQVGPLFALLQGLMYVRDLARQVPSFKFVINMSLGGYEQTASYWTTEAVNQVCQRSNVILISGCGNDKNDNSFAGVAFPISADNYYPAALSKVISVGASSWVKVQGLDREVYQEDSYNWGTNWGLSVDLCAPGSLSIYTTSRTSPTSYELYFGGTSASCAFVSGLAGLAWAKNPGWSRDKLTETLKKSCDIMWVPSNKTGKLGYGRINAFRTIKGLKPEAYINDVYWTRSGNPIFGDAIHVSGDGLFVDDEHTPGIYDDYNFRWYIDGNYVFPAAIGREAMICRLTQGLHTLHFRVWNKGQEWNFADPNQFSELVEWAPGIQIDDSDLPDDYFTMIYIPAGDFVMGCGPMNAGYNDGGSADEKPQHTHFVNSFWIRKYEITNLEFQNFMEAGGYDDPRYWEPEGWSEKIYYGWQYPLNWQSGSEKGGNPIDFPETGANPVNAISWWEADAFCRWARMHLPIEAEWEKASRGIDSPPRSYPWGMDWVVDYSNHNADTITPTATARVGTYSPQGDSPYGLCDMAGNVWEWCWEWYDYDIYNQYQTGDYTLPTSGDSKCCRGGGYIYDGAWVSRCSSRYSTAIPSTTRNGEIGVRACSSNE